MTDESNKHLREKPRNLRGNPASGWQANVLCGAPPHALETCDGSTVDGLVPRPSPAEPDAVLSARSLELLHELNEGVDTLFRKRVVDGRPHAAHRAVPLQPVESRGGGTLDELVLEIFARE